MGTLNVEKIVTATTTQTVSIIDQTFTVNSTSGITENMYLSRVSGGMVGPPQKFPSP